MRLIQILHFQIIILLLVKSIMQCGRNAIAVQVKIWLAGAFIHSFIDLFAYSLAHPLIYYIVNYLNIQLGK